MKKKSRFLTGLLSAVMALSLFALPAAAADSDATAKVPTITKNVGSLTINKYEGDKAAQDKLLDGVTFKIYKVATIEQSTTGNRELTYVWDKEFGDNKPSLNYAEDEKGSNTKNLYTSVSEKLNDTIKGKLTSYELTTGDTERGQKTGQVKFENLPIGLYLVEEKAAPAQIVDYSANFLVSIPMTNEAGDDWIYDVVANPKNVAVYGGVTLKKFGKVAGSNDDGTALAGAKFTLQTKKTNGDAVTWETVTDLTGNQVKTGSVEGSILTTSEDGTINIEGLTPGTYRFVEYSAPNGYIADGTTFYEFDINNAGNATAKANASYWVAGTGNDAKGYIKVVNEKPELDKKVKTGVDEKGNPNFGKAYDYKMGDTVTWEVETKVPSTIEGLATFKITDEMSETLDFTADQQKAVKISTNPQVVLGSNDYAFTITNATTGKGPSWTLNFTDDGKKKLASSNVNTVTVIFDTTLNSKAVVGNGGNLNDAKLEYSNGVYVDGNEHPDPGTDTINNKAVVYTFELDAVKQDGNTKTPLKDAEFTLYQYEGDANPVTEDVLKTSGKEVCKLVSADKTGKLVIKGNETEEYNGKQPKLSKGNYYLVETKAPKDENGKYYNLLKDPVKVELKPDYSITTTTVTDTDKEGNVTITRTVQTNKFDNAGKDNKGSFNVIIYNKKGFDLPTTGGFGTLLFSGIGALLVVGGVGVLMSTKKKKGNT